MSTLICPNCKYKTEGNEQFCCKCGTKLQSDLKKTFCKSCGAELKSDALFCVHCGVQQNKTECYMCDKCGATVESEEQFCSKCGTKVEVPLAVGAKTEIETIYQKGMEHYKNSRFVSAFVLLKDAAEHGHPKGQYYLGLSYRFGLGIKQDINEAEKWEKAAKEQGIDEDSMTESRTILLEKAERGDADAQWKLGVLLISEGTTCLFQNNNRNGGISCLEKAEKWLRRAAEQGYAPAQTELALYYAVHHRFTMSSYSCWDFAKDILGLGNENRYNKMSAELYRVAAEQGNAKAQWHLGICYENGLGVKKNEAKAFNLYCMAAKEGFGESHLGECYRRGIGTEKDETEAIKWFCKAKEHGQIS